MKGVNKQDESRIHLVCNNGSKVSFSAKKRLHDPSFTALYECPKTVAVKSVEHFDVISQIYDDSFSLITSGCSGSLREPRERACACTFHGIYPPNGEFALSSTVREKEPALIHLKEALPIRNKDRTLKCGEN